MYIILTTNCNHKYIGIEGRNERMGSTHVTNDIEDAMKFKRYIPALLYSWKIAWIENTKCEVRYIG